MTKLLTRLVFLTWGVLFFLDISFTIFLPTTQAAQTKTNVYSNTSPLSYYIDPINGNDSLPNDGLSPSKAFKTIQKAADDTNPGDTVYLMKGTYTDANGVGILNITRSGTAEAYITYKAYPGDSPVLHATKTWSHMWITGASYISIQGLIIDGNNPNISYDYAYSQKDNGNNAATNTNGITITTNADGAIPHHIFITGNIVSNCPGGGIVTNAAADYVTINYNIVHSNAWYGVYAASGISLLNLTDIDNNTGYKNYIENNQVYDNEAKIPWIAIHDYSDGNGIIIDSNKHQDTTNPPYNGRTLVTNNLTYDNGGSGIHSFESSHVDIVNNTAYFNSRNPNLKYYGNIFATFSDDVNVINNVSYIRAGKSSNGANYQNTNVTYDYNLYYNGVTPTVLGTHDLIADPQFVNASTDPSVADFRLQASSSAINTGTSNLASLDDFNAIPRPQGSGYDRGAFEYVPPPTLQQSVSPVAFLPGGQTTLTFNLSNNSTATLNHVAFAETFPTQLSIANPASVINNCGATSTIRATSGTNAFSVAGLSLLPNQNCSISLKITSNVVGTYQISSARISADQITDGRSSNTLDVPVVVPIFEASPLFSNGAQFKIGAAKPNSSKTESLTLTNAGHPVTHISISSPTLSGGDANRFAILNSSGDFPLDLSGGTSYDLNLQCNPLTTGLLTTNLNFTTTGAGISTANHTIEVSCSGGYVVTKPSDDGGPGSLSYILKNQAVNSGDGVLFELTGGATTITLGAGALLPLQVGAGVTIDAGCSSRIKIVGNSGVANSLYLQGKNYLAGLYLQNIRLVAHSQNNMLQCDKIEFLH